MTYFRPLKDLEIKTNTIKTYVNVGMNDKDDINKVRNILTKHMKDCMHLCNYAKCILDTEVRLYDNVNSLFNTCEQTLRLIMTVDTVTEIKDSMQNVLYFIGEVECRLDYVSSWHFKSTASDLRTTSYYCNNFTGPELDPIVQAINSDKPLNIFSISCTDGKQEEFLKDGLNSMNEIPVKVYALGEESYKNCSRDRVDKLILGQLKGSIISNNAFDIVYANPSITFVCEYNASKKLKTKNEEFILNSSIRYLKPGGLLIFHVPFYAINPNMFLTLARNLKQIQMIKYDNKRVLKYVTIMGIKTTNFSYSEKFNELINLTHDDLSTVLQEEYNLDLPETEINLFRGSILDESELDKIILNDGLYNSFFKSISDEQSEEDKSPLLPFNIGQVGLILSSGSLDGIVEEDDGTVHVIKGMTIKETDHATEQVVENGRTITQSTETVRNRVQITALGADGTIYNLT